MGFVLLQVYFVLIYLRPQDWASLPAIRYMPLMDYVMAALLGSFLVQLLATRIRCRADHRRPHRPLAGRLCDGTKPPRRRRRDGRAVARGSLQLGTLG